MLNVKHPYCLSVEVIKLEWDPTCRNVKYEEIFFPKCLSVGVLTLGMDNSGMLIVHFFSEGFY